jgi:hypothetical protein
VRLVPDSRPIVWSDEEELVIGVEQWAEIRRLYFVERRSKRAIHRLTGVHRDTITRAVSGEGPPKYRQRAPTGSRLDPFKDWICEQLRADATIQSLRLGPNTAHRCLKTQPHEPGSSRLATTGQT